eukprot:2279117-Amphidinium_carterae.1
MRSPPPDHKATAVICMLALITVGPFKMRIGALGQETTLHSVQEQKQTQCPPSKFPGRNPCVHFTL